MIPSTTESFRAKNLKKFGSGNGANARQKSSLKSFFPQIAHFNAEQTVLFSGWRNCAKITQFTVRPQTRRGPECQNGLKIRGVPGGGKKNGFFPGNARNCQQQFSVGAGGISG
jgi:hypothetical protein